MKDPFFKTGLAIVLLAFCFSCIHAQNVAVDSSRGAQSWKISHAVKGDAIAVNNWWWGWLAGYSAATAGQGIAGISSADRSFRQDMYLGAATTLVGAIGQFFAPVQPVRIKSLHLPESDSVPEFTRQNEYQEYLVKMAAAEKKGRGWQMHLTSGGVNVCSGLITWLGFKRPFREGLVNFALNTVITEAQIWSQPIRAKKYYREFLQLKNSGSSSRIREKPGKCVYVSASGRGIRLAVAF